MDPDRIAQLEDVAAPFARAKPLPRWAFVDPAVLDHERARVFAARPVPVAHVADVPRPGDWVRAPLLGEHVIVVRGADLELHALHAVCAHRGTLLAEGESGRFETLEITCPYHGLSYATDGALLRAPCAPEGADLRRLSLQRVALSGSPFGVIFATTSPSEASSPLALPPWLTHPSLRGLVRARRTDHEVAANWKTLVANFQESHHFPWVHPSLEARTPFRRSNSVLSSSGWLGGEMELGEAWETVSESGKLKGRARIGDGGDAGRVLDALVFPLLLTSLQPDYLLTYRLAPLTVDRTLVVAEILVHQRSLAEGDLEDVFSFWDRTNAEDRRICELQQRGLASPAAEPRFYAESEDGLHAFEALVASALLDDRHTPARRGAT